MYLSKDEDLLEEEKRLYEQERLKISKNLEKEFKNPIIFAIIVGSYDLLIASVKYSDPNKFLENMKKTDERGNSVFDYLRMFRAEKEGDPAYPFRIAIEDRLVELGINPSGLDKNISNKKIPMELWIMEIDKRMNPDRIRVDSNLIFSFL